MKMNKLILKKIAIAILTFFYFSVLYLMLHPDVSKHYKDYYIDHVIEKY